MDLRLALLSHDYPPYTFGGVGSFAYLLAEALGAQGVAVSVVAGLPSGANGGREHEKDFELPNVSVTRFPYPGIPPRHFWFQVRNSSRIREVLKPNDVIHGQSASSYPTIGVVGQSLPRIPWVVTFHLDPFNEFKARVKRQALAGITPEDAISFVGGFPNWQWTIHRELALTSTAVAVSASLAADISRFARGKKIEVVRNGIDLARLEEASPRTSGPRGEGLQIVYAGRLYYGKGILTLLSVMRLLVHGRGLKNVRLLVFGKGPLEGKARRAIQRNSLEGNVELMGFLPRKQVLASIAESDALALPSVYEANPIVAMEAAGLGKPVVAFDRPFSREIILPGRTGFLASDEAEFADGIEQLYRSGELRATMGAEAKRFASRNFDVAQTAKRYTDIYLNAIEGLRN